jgi:hypothetical protein
MQLSFMYDIKATVWFPVGSTPLTKQIVIPAKSVIQIKGAGVSDGGTIIADGYKYSLFIDFPNPGNINFHNDGEKVYGEGAHPYKEFNPTTAEEFLPTETKLSRKR